MNKIHDENPYIDTSQPDEETKATITSQGSYSQP